MKYSQIIGACGYHPRKKAYKTINYLPDNLKGISKEEFGKMVHEKLLFATAKHTYALLSPTEIRAIYYAFLEYLLPNQNGKYTKTAQSIQNDIDKFFLNVFDYNLLPRNLRDMLEYFHTHGVFDELRAKTLNTRIKIAYNLALAYLDAHRGTIDDFIALNRQLKLDVVNVFSKKATWAIAIPAVSEIELMLKYLANNSLLSLYGWNGDYLNLVKYISPFPSNIFDNFARYIAYATTTKSGIVDIAKGIFTSLGADFLSSHTTQYLQSGIFRSLYHFARASYLAQKSARFLASLFGGFVGFVGFTAFEWLVLEPLYNVVLSHVFEALLPLQEKTPHPIEIQALYDYLRKIHSGYALTDAEQAHFELLKQKYGEKVLFTLLNQIEVEQYLEQLRNLKKYFDEKLADAIDEYINGRDTIDEVENLSHALRNIHRAVDILLKGKTASCSYTKVPRVEKKQISESTYSDCSTYLYSFDAYIYRHISASSSSVVYIDSADGMCWGEKYSSFQSATYRYEKREDFSISVSSSPSGVVCAERFVHFLHALRAGVFDIRSIRAYVSPLRDTFSFSISPRSQILKPVLRRKCISLAYAKRIHRILLPAVAFRADITYELFEEEKEERASGNTFSVSKFTLLKKRVAKSYSLSLEVAQTPDGIFEFAFSFNRYQHRYSSGYASSFTYSPILPYVDFPCSDPCSTYDVFVPLPGGSFSHFSNYSVFELPPFSVLHRDIEKLSPPSVSVKKPKFICAF